MAYVTHGDPYSDPPRAKVCTLCGALVGDQEQHNWFHEHRRIATERAAGGMITKAEFTDKVTGYIERV